MAARSGPNDLDLLTRFACFGSEDGSFSVFSKREYSKEQTSSIQALLSSNKGLDAVKRLKAVSQHKCYVRKECLLYALARIIREASPQEIEHKDDLLRKEAYTLVQELCDSSSNLFTFVHFDKQVTIPPRVSWGRGMRNLISRWYGSKSSLELAREATKCKSSLGWTHKDLLTQVHFNSKPKSKGFSAVMAYLIKGKSELENIKDIEEQEDQTAVSVINAVEKLKASQDIEGDIIRSLIEVNALTDRQIPTHFNRFRESFEGQIGHLPLSDLIRNIPKMAEFGMLERMAPTSSRIFDRLQDLEAVKRERVSPVTIFIALRKYDMNRAKRWIRNPYVSRLMHMAYDAALRAVPKIGKRFLLAIHLDAKISKSHVSGANILTSIMPCTMMAQMLSHAEEDVCFTYFNSTKVSELKVTNDLTAVQVIEQILHENKDQGNQIFSLVDPIVWASGEQKAFDCILIMSDKKEVTSKEAFHNSVSSYRSQCNIPNAKIAVVGLNDATPLGNGGDLNFLDVTGFNAEVPILLHNFFKGVPDNAV